MLHLDCPRCGRVVTEDDRTCRDCGYETSSLHWRLTRTAKRRFMPAQKEFKSLYERLGGKDVVEQAVDLFYERSSPTIASSTSLARSTPSAYETNNETS